LTRRFVVLLAILSLASCNFREQKDYAENCALKHLRARERGGLDEALQYYSPRFFNEVPKAEWQATLQKVQQKLGPPTAFELRTWNTTERALNDAPGSYVTLTYAVTYEHGTGTETFCLFRARGSDDVAIVSHNILSRDLLN